MPQDFRKDQPKLDGVSWDMVPCLSLVYFVLCILIIKDKVKNSCFVDLTNLTIEFCKALGYVHGCWVTRLSALCVCVWMLDYELMCALRSVKWMSFTIVHSTHYFGITVESRGKDYPAS